MLRNIARVGFSSSENTTNFGYKRVNIDEKQGHVNNVFHSVAANYDLMNDVLSLGIHRCWKNTFVDELGLLQPSKVVVGDKLVETPLKVLDVAGGTGDIAFRIIKKF
jgi:ubiquinone/menaquinone biosynthesis C-methylase UbiE